MSVGQPDHGVNCPASLPLPLTGVEMSAWQALRAVSLRLGDLLTNDLAASTELSLSQYDVLMRLADAPDTRLRMAALAKEINLSPSRFSHTVERLEAQGLVERVTCPKDRRGVECALTSAGAKLLADNAAKYFGAVRERVLAPYAEPELKQNSALLRRLVQN